MSRMAIAILPLLAIGAAPARDDSVGLRANSWGSLIREWRIDANGNGILRDGATGRAPRSNGYEVVDHAVYVGPAGYAKLRRLLQPAEAAARQHYSCRVTMTDQVYGSVYWTMAARRLRYDFNDGCMARRDRDLQTAMRAADAIVVDAAKNAPVTTRTKVGPDTPLPAPLNEDQ